MAKGLREIKGRIKAVKGTAQITRAMQLVASSKMKRAQDAALAGREYRRLLADMLDGALSRLGETFTHPLTATREVKKRGIVLVTTDKGLCGGLNTNLLRVVAELPKENVVFVTVGRKGAQYVARTGRELLADFPVSDKAAFHEVRVIGEFLLQKFLDGEIDTVEVVYPQFKNALLQIPVNVQLLPVTDLATRAHELQAKLGNPASGGTTEQDDRDMIFEPSIEAVLAELPAIYFKEELHQKILEAKASEHSARMVAMKAATDNAKKIAHALTLEYNKSRQAAITQEILEITAAANS
jgi:F-type H+-transporting ATPase subunit gamma